MKSYILTSLTLLQKIIKNSNLSFLFYTLYIYYKPISTNNPFIFPLIFVVPNTENHHYTTIIFVLFFRFKPVHHKKKIKIFVLSLGLNPYIRKKSNKRTSQVTRLTIHLTKKNLTCQYIVFSPIKICETNKILV